ncbi:hypothetical protein [Sphingomonas sp.]|uniref:hypothetical protein n=1 Tax=Sphingomonas sp. TaxID=28214 RepID=UPI003D6D73DD
MSNPSYLPTTKVSPDSPLFTVVEEAYRVFRHPKPKSIGVCERCCMDLAIEQDFFNSPIRELPLSYVRDWYLAAYDPAGIPKETWAYLLPRILEILAAGEDVSSVATEVSLNRFETGNPEKWSLKEWKVLDDFQRTYLSHEIEHGDHTLDDMLCMFSLAGWDLQGLLDQVLSARDEILAQRLWNDWCRYGQASGIGTIWVTAFWESPENSAAYEFYTSRGLHDRMEALALADDADAELAAKASAVATLIDANR